MKRSRAIKLKWSESEADEKNIQQPNNKFASFNLLHQLKSLNFLAGQLFLSAVSLISVFVF